MALTYSLPQAVTCPVATGITTTGGTSPAFCLEPSSTQDDWTLTLSAVGIGAVPTAVTTDLEVSTDGGATWQKYATGLALVTAGVATMQKVVNCPAGPLLRLNPTTVTLGSATSVTFNAQIN